MKSIKRVAFAALVLIALVSTSCKRGGYGCPYELKVNIPVSGLLK